MIPVSHIRKVDELSVKTIFEPHKNIDTSYFNSEADQGDIIHLKFFDLNEHTEKQTTFMYPILPEDIKDIMDCFVIVVAAVIDFEVHLETLKYIKDNSNIRSNLMLMVLPTL
ncbi:hypothetical protein [Winogradskyella sp. J14-2]|uniref:hypothetical protein n=1 Tax=Winogradskyella sp. J14-2 TaxID=1936080 RepID=UPI0009F85931|nr:hypothetical protein [Winogradskyella sp. J14-2]